MERLPSASVASAIQVLRTHRLNRSSLRDRLGIARRERVERGPRPLSESRRRCSREDALIVHKEAADLERLRFDEIFEPRLTFEEWVDAGQPAVHRTGDAPRRLKARARP